MTLAASMAKLFASEVAVRVADDGVQIHGGYGLVKDYPAEKFFRDVKLLTIGEGTSEILPEPFLGRSRAAARCACRTWPFDMDVRYDPVWI